MNPKSQSAISTPKSPRQEAISNEARTLINNQRDATRDAFESSRRGATREVFDDSGWSTFG